MLKTAGSSRSKRRAAAADAVRLPARWPAAVVVAAVTLAVFWPAVHNQFVNWDDDKNFLTNPYFRGLDWSRMQWMFTTFHLGHYHPLTWITLGLDYTLWGLDPAGYHLTNLVLHAANAVLFYWVALRVLGGGIWTAALAALLFAVHPLRVESVAWVSERRDVLSGLFYLLSALAYLRAHQEGPRRRWLAVSLAAFAAALLAKVIVVSLPVVLLALDVYPLRRRPQWLEKIPYFAMAAAAAIAALALQKTGVSGFTDHVTMLPALRAGLSLYGLAFYLWKTVLPFGLYPQYALPGARIVMSAAAVAAITVAAIALRRRFPGIAAVWICYVASLLPVLSIVRLDPQQFVADHHTYLATLGLALLGAAALAAIPSRQAAAVAAAVLVVFSALSRRQIGVWRDPLSLWTSTLAGAPDSAVAHNNLGEALAAQNRLDDAMPHFARAIEIKPGYAHAHYNLGRALQRQGKLEVAVAQFEQALKTEPAFAAAHDDLANCYASLGRRDAALEEYRLALRYDPDFADAHYNLANLLQSGGQLSEATSHYAEALRLNPALADAHNNWGVALDALGRPKEAMEHYRLALTLDPQNADAHNNLGAELESEGKAQEALAQYREAVRLNPSHRDARANLARALERLKP